MPDPIRIAVVGTAHPHAPAKVKVLRELPLFTLAALAEADSQARAGRESQEEFRDLCWRAPEEILTDSSIAAVVVEGRVSENLAIARAAVLAGKHIHLEKPAGTDLPAYRSLLDEAQARGLVVQMGYMMRYNRGFQFAFGAASEGWLGDIFSVHGDISTNTMPSEGRTEHSLYSGGLMFSFGSHLIDALVTLLGRPGEILPLLAHDGSQPDALADNTAVMFRFQRASAVITSAGLGIGAFPLRHFEIRGTSGTVVIRPLEPPAVCLCLRQPVAGFAAGWQEIPVEDTPRYRDDFIEWAACIRGERQPTYSPAHDLLVQETVLRACGVAT